jgi:hypothetical protein
MKRLAIATIFARANLLGSSSSVAAGHSISMGEPRRGVGSGLVRRWGRIARICAATISGTVASIAVPSITAPRLAKLEIEQRTLRVLPNMSSTIPRRSPLYDTIT